MRAQLSNLAHQLAQQVVGHRSGGALRRLAPVTQGAAPGLELPIVLDGAHSGQIEIAAQLGTALFAQLAAVALPGLLLPRMQPGIGRRRLSPGAPRSRKRAWCPGGRDGAVAPPRSYEGVGWGFV